MHRIYSTGGFGEGARGHAPMTPEVALETAISELVYTYEYDLRLLVSFDNCICYTKQSD